MRPVEKKKAGEIINTFKVLPEYNPYQEAKPVLIANLGEYCSYCERPVDSEDIDVEHIQPKSLASEHEFSWDNFLLSCGRCNGKDNKSNKRVVLENIHLPHRDNTLLSIQYIKGGLVRINPIFHISSNDYLKTKALIDLVGLDKRPGHPNFLPKDKRFEKRKVAWELAEKYLQHLVNGNTNVDTIIDLAVSRGFFSIWFSVFHVHDEVKSALINAFSGTAANCFDSNNHYNPIPRSAQ